MMIRSSTAELLVIRKRASTWILLGMLVLLGLLFAYLLPYLTHAGGPPGQPPPAELLPDRLTTTLLGGFPLFGGIFALILGVLAIGSDYGWDTLKTLLTQRASRLSLFGAKLVAMAAALIGFVLAVFLAGVIASYTIAQAEDATLAWPSAGDLLAAVAGAWLVLAAWAACGMLLAALSRGTALAIGLGITYLLVIEGLLSALSTQVSWLNSLAEYFLRANAYSLVIALGVPTETLTQNGPAAFFGPYISGGHALAMLTACLAVFLTLSAFLLRRRDVT